MIYQNSPIVALFEFASLPMLGWLAAAALPWLIHRLYRRQHHTTSWAAVELLLSAMLQRARRIQIQQWLLLAVRTAILVFVALAAAEPALRSWAVGASGKSQAHRIVVLDRSFSMAFLQSGETRWQRAKAQARRLIENSDGDPVTLIAWGSQAESVLGRPTFDASLALSALDDLELSDSTAELATVTQKILAAIERCESELPQIAEHRVVFCSDFCQPTWTFEAAQQELLGSIAGRAQVTMVEVAEPNSHNVAVTDVTIRPDVILRQSETTITASIDCFGDAAKQNPVVELLLNGQRAQEQQIMLRSDSKTTVQFTYRFIDEGPQTITVRLRGVADGLAIDDQRSLVVEVRPQLRIACVAGFPGAADDLARALSPSLSQNSDGSAIAAEVYSLSRLSELDLQDYAAVFLCSVDHLTDRELALLESFVRQRRGLAVFLGPELSADSTLESLLPVTIAGEVKTGEFRFDVLEHEHPIVSPFRGQTQAGLLGVAISRYQQIGVLADRPMAETVLRFDSGDAALVVDRYGLGTVAVSALPAALSARATDGTPWSTFAVSPSFLPVVRELTNFLVGNGRQQQRNLLVGEPVVVPWSDSSESIEVRRPDGSVESLPVPMAVERGQLTYPQADRSGVYSFAADNAEFARVAVNHDARECDPRSVARKELPSGIQTHEGASVVGVNATRDFSFVRYLLSGALLLLLVEIGLAWLMGRGWG